MMNKISIIVPVYNAEKYLKQCVESLMDQTYKNLEILLINDGSKDNSLAICKKYAEVDSRIKVFDKQNSGVSATRNFGLDNATGDYVMFVDSDDYIDLDMCEQMIASATQSDSDVVVCGIKYVVDGKEVENKEINLENAFVKKELQHFISGKDMVIGSACRQLIKKALLKDIRFNIQISIKEDLIFTLEVLQKSQIVSYAPNVFYLYRGNLSGNYFEKYDYVKAIKDYAKVAFIVEELFFADKSYDEAVKVFKFSSYLGICKAKIYGKKAKSLTHYISKSDLKKLNNKENERAFFKEKGGLKTKVFVVLAKFKMFYLLKLMQKIVDKK